MTLLTPALAAILGLALAGVPMTVQADDTTAAPAASSASMAKVSYSGKVSAVDASGGTITVQAAAKKKGEPAKAITLTVNSTTEITKDKKSATLADFKVGDDVAGSYVTESSGSLTATALSSAPTKKPVKGAKGSTPKTSKKPTPTPTPSSS